MSKRLASYLSQSKSQPGHSRKVHQAEVAADLRVLIAASGKTFKEVADVIGISAAALSKKLGGETNLTLDSIVDISGAIEADFDIVFRPKSAHRARQPSHRPDQRRHRRLMIDLILAGSLVAAFYGGFKLGNNFKTLHDAVTHAIEKLRT